MDNIDLLYCNGCSFTRMASHKGFPELEDQWPHLLANKLGTEIVNDALWNGSNPRTFRKLEEFLTTFPVDTTRVFCLIQFTFPWRFEMPHDEEIYDYTWQDCNFKEDWIRLNPGHFDLEGYRNKDNLNPCVAIKRLAQPSGKDNSSIINEGLDKIHGKLVRYTNQVERLDLLTHVYAIKGLLEEHGCKYKFIMGDHSKFGNKLTNDFISVTLRSLMKDNTGVDNYHADHQGNKNTANSLNKILMSDTDK